MAYTRRDFLSTTGTSLAALPFLGLPLQVIGKQELTIQEAIDHITSQLGFELPEQTVDTVKSGDSSAVLTGIGTTFMATVPVIRQAIEAKVNLIIPHEPTYYNHQDHTEWLAQDPRLPTQKSPSGRQWDRRLAIPRSLAPLRSGWDHDGILSAIGMDRTA